MLTAFVVNCAEAKTVVPLGQVAFTLQSYVELAVKPDRLTDVDAVLAVATVHVPDELSL